MSVRNGTLTIEMRVLRVKRKYLKILSNSYFMLNPITPISGLSNEILFILVAQETAKLPKIKFGGLKKILPLSPICTTQVLKSSSAEHLI